MRASEGFSASAQSRAFSGSVNGVTLDDVIVTVGGTIPSDDVQELKALGVAEVFTPGASTQQAIDFIRGAVRA